MVLQPCPTSPAVVLLLRVLLFVTTTEKPRLLKTATPPHTTTTEKPRLLKTATPPHMTTAEKPRLLKTATPPHMTTTEKPRLLMTATRTPVVMPPHMTTRSWMRRRQQTRPKKTEHQPPSRGAHVLRDIIHASDFDADGDFEYVCLS